MFRRSIVMCAVSASAALSAIVYAQSPGGQGTPSFREQLLGNPAMTCRLGSDGEVEVEYLDKSVVKVKVPPSRPRAVQPAPTAQSGTKGAAVPTGTHPLAAALAAAMAKAPAEASSSAVRGFDDSGQPYVDQRLSTGNTRREQPNGTTVTRPDGVKVFNPATPDDGVLRAGAPPALSADPMQGRAWIEAQNAVLLAAISAFVRGDAREMAKFQAGEERATDNDLFAQMAYRTAVARFFANATTPQ